MQLILYFYDKYEFQQVLNYNGLALGTAVDFDSLLHICIYRYVYIPWLLYVNVIRYGKSYWWLPTPAVFYRTLVGSFQTEFTTLHC